MFIFRAMKTTFANPSDPTLEHLNNQLDGSLVWDTLSQALYATDASVYKERPSAVAFPKSEKDIQTLVAFAQKHQIGLIPRTAGTSLAGQCVGSGIVVDVSKHMTKILEIDKANKTVTVQPGVIRDELNKVLKPLGLFFGPNTSTSNRCMIGGMVGNNSSGTTSIQYGVTRDKVLAINAVLSDGSTAEFKNLDPQELLAKQQGTGLEAKLYKNILEILTPPQIQQQIRKHYPHPDVHRRNTGYALDALIDLQPFNPEGAPFSLTPLLCGSEGTLAFSTAITLKLDPLPPPHSAMVVAHFHSIQDCLEAVSLTMQHDLQTCEMLDKTILDCTLQNPEQRQNRFFVEQDPMALLMLEVAAETVDACDKKTTALLQTLNSKTASYANPVLLGFQIQQAIELRKAGLGLLGNMVGDAKAVACIEDTAVPLKNLAAYIAEFSALMAQYNQKAVYYAHAGAGELHLRPILNLKTEHDVVLFRKITTDVAHLVKKYEGSMSGEHGDGLVRSEFIRLMLGDENMLLLQKIKTAFDPNGLMNPGKIIDPWPMDQKLRTQPFQPTPEVDTIFDFSKTMGIVRAAEQCNGSGDCRKLSGGTMCPSYRATRDEKDSTRGRANALRAFLYEKPNKNRFNHPELKAVFDLCLSCKACASECPSNVDISAYKAEFLHQYYQHNKRPLSDYFFGFAGRLYRFGSHFPKISNVLLQMPIFANTLRRVLQVAPERSWPLLSTPSFENRLKKLKNHKLKSSKKVYLFIDEFTNFLEAEVGMAAVELLENLGYQVEVVTAQDSARSQLSKGFLKAAQKQANLLVAQFKDKISAETPLLGIEPSALFGFVDEFPKLADDKRAAQELAKHCFLIETFLLQEMALGHISEKAFSTEGIKMALHIHCHQKAWGRAGDTAALFRNIKGVDLEVLNTGCCGMAGSFGYEAAHYEVSQKIGEESLFPAIRKAEKTTWIVANGTSCRHQIMDGCQRSAIHPIQALLKLLA